MYPLMTNPKRVLKKRSIEAIEEGRETLQKGANTLDKVGRHFHMSITCFHICNLRTGIIVGVNNGGNQFEGL